MLLNQLIKAYFVRVCPLVVEMKLPHFRVGEGYRLKMFHGEKVKECQPHTLSDSGLASDVNQL